MSIRPLLAVGSRGPDVVCWQRVLGVATDGVFGPNTARATRAWQEAHHLKADGKVGPATWGAAEGAFVPPPPSTPPPAHTAKAWPSVMETFVRFSAEFEGVISWMYADSKGFTTIGIGCLIDPLSLALPLPFLRADGTPASQADITAEWQLIERMKVPDDLARLGAKASKRLCFLHLSPTGIEQVVAQRLAANIRIIARRFPDFEAWPAPGQLSILSLAWACGAGFYEDYPKLSAALDPKDFAEAALHVDINEKKTKGVHLRNLANVALLKQAAESVAQGRDPGVLLPV